MLRTKASIIRLLYNQFDIRVAVFIRMGPKSDVYKEIYQERVLPLTPVRSGGGRRGPGGAGGGGSGCSGGLIPREVVGSVVGLSQLTLPPMVEGILVWRQPVLVLDVWVSVCRQHLEHKDGLETSGLAWKSTAACDDGLQCMRLDERCCNGQRQTGPGRFLP